MQPTISMGLVIHLMLNRSHPRNAVTVNKVVATKGTESSVHE